MFCLTFPLSPEEEKEEWKFNCRTGRGNEIFLNRGTFLILTYISKQNSVKNKCSKNGLSFNALTSTCRVNIIYLTKP